MCDDMRIQDFSLELFHWSFEIIPSHCFEQGNGLKQAKHKQAGAACWVGK